MSHSMQFGASLSGTQKGGCFPSMVPDSIEELLSEISGDGTLPPSASTSDVSWLNDAPLKRFTLNKID